MKPAKIGDVSRVIIDNLVLMKIVKHSKSADYKSANGQLLGLYNDNSGILEITNSYPLPNKEGNDAAQATEDNYDTSVMSRLDVVNWDNNKVGWYQVSYTNDHLSFVSFDQQIDYQVLIYLFHSIILLKASSSLCSFYGL